MMGGVCGDCCVVLGMIWVMLIVIFGVRISDGSVIGVKGDEGRLLRQEAGLPQECPTLIEERVQGGEDVVSKDVIKFMAHFFVTGKDGEGEPCSGTLISDEWVLTAAHCFVNATQKLFTMQVGARAGTSDNGTVVDVDKVIRHPRYEGLKGDGRNDVALIKLEKKVKGLGDGAVRITKDDKINSGNARVVGYGDIGFQQPGDMLLKQVDVPIVGFEECKAMLGEARLRDRTLQALVEKKEKDLEEEANMCAGYTDGGCDSCTNGDGGGPLLMVDGKGRFFQVGITALGAGCGFKNAPGIYTRVATYVDWIQKNSRNAASVRKASLERKYVIVAGIGGGIVLLALLYIGIGLVKRIRMRKGSGSDST